MVRLEAAAAAALAPIGKEMDLSLLEADQAFPERAQSWYRCIHANV